MKITQAIEGTILATYPFEETAHILSVFSKEHGRIKCVHKSQRKSTVRGLSPLLGVELVVLPSEKELWKCQELTVVTSYPQLRLKLEHLRYGAQITALLDKLLPLHLVLSELYDIYLSYLAHLPHFQFPQVAACAFLEKLYEKEGMLEKAPLFGKKSFAELYDEKISIGLYERLLHQVHR